MVVVVVLRGGGGGGGGGGGNDDVEIARLKNSFRCDSIPAVGIPETIVSGNGPQYPSHEFVGLVGDSGFAHCIS